MQAKTKKYNLSTVLSTVFVVTLVAALDVALAVESLWKFLEAQKSGSSTLTQSRPSAGSAAAEGDQVMGLQNHNFRVQDLDNPGTIKPDGPPDRSDDALLQNRQKTSSYMLRLPLSSHPYRTLAYTDSPLGGDVMGREGYCRNLTQNFNGLAGGVVYHLAIKRSTPLYKLDG